MVRNFWNPEEIALPDDGKVIPPGFEESLAFQIGCDSILRKQVTLKITEEHFQEVEDAYELVSAYKPHWFDVEALCTFFTFCANRNDMYKPACDVVDRLADEVKNWGWNDDRVRRFKNLDMISREIYDTDPYMFLQEM